MFSGTPFPEARYVDLPNPSNLSFHVAGNGIISSHSGVRYVSVAGRTTSSLFLTSPATEAVSAVGLSALCRISLTRCGAM